MSIFTSGINSALSDTKSADRTANRLGQQLTTGRKIQSPQDDPSVWLEGSRADSASTYLDAVHTGLEEVATNLAVVDTTMQAIGRQLQTMRGQLTQALNAPAGDPARQQYVATFNALRGQIDEIVSTTSSPEARNLMSGPAADPQAGSVQVLIGLNGETHTVRGQEVDTAATGLNIAALDPATATDADLQTALGNVASAQAALTSREAGLGADSADIKRYAAETSQAAGLYQTRADSLTADDPTETAVELQSVQTQQSLAMQTLASMGSDRNALLELLK